MPENKINDKLVKASVQIIQITAMPENFLTLG